MTSNESTEEQRQRSPSNYEGLNPAELALLRRPRAPDHYTGIGSTQPQSTTDAQGYLVPVDLSANENHGTLEQHQQPSGQHQVEVNRQGYQGLDPAVVEELRRPWRPHSYAGIDAGSPADRNGRHSYLEIIGYAGTDNPDVPRRAAKSYEGLDRSVVEELRRPQRPHSYAGIDTPGRHSYLEIIGYAGTDNCDDAETAAKNYEGLDPAEVEEMRRRANIPPEYAGLRDNNTERSQGEVAESKGYEGLDPDEVEEFRQRARRPPEYAGLTDGNRDRSQGEVAESKGKGYEGLDPDEVEAFRRRARRPPEYAGLRENVEDLYSLPKKKH